MPSRRDFVVRSAAITGAAVAGFPTIISSARAADKVAMTTANGFLPDFIEMFNAYSGGHFAAQGIDAQIFGANGTAQAVQLLMGGKAQFAKFSAVDLLKTIGKISAPFVSVCTLAQASSFHILSSAERPIEKAEDMKGKKIGIVSIGGTTDTYIDLILNSAGLPLDSVQKQTVGNTPAAFQFVKRGDIDCCIVTLAVIGALQEANEKFVYWSTDRYAPLPGLIYLTLRDVTEKNPELVVRYLRALKASVVELMTQPIAPIFQRARKDFEIPNLGDLDAQAKIERNIIDRLWLSEGKENLMRNVPRLWRDGATATEALGLGKFGDGSALYTNTFIDQALKPV